MTESELLELLRPPEKKLEDALRRIAELEASRLALIRQIDTVVWNFEHGSVTVAEHERAWRNVLAWALANK